MSYLYFLSAYFFRSIKALENIHVFAKEILPIINLLTESRNVL